MANRRVVRSEPLDRHLVDLETKIDSDGRPCVYTGYVSGDRLDETVTPERTDFTFARNSDLLSDNAATWPLIVDGCVQRAQDYLKPFTDPIREAKHTRILQYVQHERPLFRPLVKHRPAVLDRIPHNVTKEKMDAELYRYLRVYEEELREQGDKVMNAIDTLDPAQVEEYGRLMEGFLEEWNEVGITRLAEYVAHRRATLKILEKTIAVGADGRYALESAVHKVVFPMRTTSDDVPADQMNLWIVDEKLAYHRYLASDQPLETIEVLDLDGKQRPDLLVFDRPVAFSDRASGHEAITIIEFKRPLRNDYDAGHNPIQQVYDYADRIRSGAANDRSGRPFTVPPSIRFYAYIICDLTERLRTQA